MKFQMNSSVEKIWRRKREKKTARILSRDPATAAASDRAFASDSSPSPLRASQASASSPPALLPILPRASRSRNHNHRGRARRAPTSGRGIHRHGVRGPRLLHHRRRRPGRRRGRGPAGRARQGDRVRRGAPRVRRPRRRRGILHGRAPSRRRQRPR